MIVKIIPPRGNYSKTILIENVDEIEQTNDYLLLCILNIGWVNLQLTDATRVISYGDDKKIKTEETLGFFIKNPTEANLKLALRLN